MSIEAYVRNWENGKKTDNYAAALEQARLSFVGGDMEEMARRSGSDLSDGFFRVPLFSRTYAVSSMDGRVTAPDGRPADYGEGMIVYDLLANRAPDAFPSGEFTKLENLSAAVTSAPIGGGGMFGRVSRRFSGRTKELEQACRALGGCAWGRGDVSFRIPFCADMDCAVTFWDADEEFPASVNVYFDRQALRYMHYETLWYAAFLLLDRLAEEMGLR